MKTKDLVHIALFAALIGVCAQITIPTPIVPFTLQPFAISLTALTLPRKQAVSAVILYVLLGLIGLPVFAGGSGGFGVVLSPTFGFIVGFIPMAYAIATFKDKKVYGFRILSLIAGIVVLYGIAMPYLYYNLTVLLEAPTEISKLLMLYCLPYLPTDSLSSVVSSWISDRIPV
ncbi:hypothetical protein AOC36_09165 [Erysipelothrix larvae]|uniref:Biotin transporter n=1 Tax=Erysipelothrix larvae TaxID=1514105 RepID=A0A0X8H144_9FIRM|nr:biotin transporter BioY [Erysipelothrix larvae]AMC94151.1 hypothetical protein AOC36_09165 [Erysipelothrix larvae]